MYSQVRWMACAAGWTVVVVMWLGCAAQNHTNQAYAAMAADDPVSARHHFRRALDHDSKLARKPEFAESFHVAKRDAAVLEGRNALARGDNKLALERFRYALGVQPGFEAAQDGLTEANRRAADALHESALRAADAGDLVEAKRLLDEALGHEPTHIRSVAARQSLRWAWTGAAMDGEAAGETRWAAAVAAYEAAVGLADGQKWDAALSELERVVQSHPDFLPARAAIPATRQCAAAALRSEGDAALAAGQFDQAAAAYREILVYAPGDNGVRPALGRVDLARAERYRAAGQTGRAWLSYRAAGQRLEGQPEAAAVRTGSEAATREILARGRTMVNLSSDATDNDTQALLQRVRGRLADGGGVIEMGDGGQEVVVMLERLEVPEATVRSRTLGHRYEVPYQAVNPELVTYRDQLAHHERRVIRLRRGYHSSERSYHASLHLGHDHHHVKHLHYQYDCARRDYHSAVRECDRVRYRLSSISPTVTRYRTETWSYTKETHERTAEIVATVAWDGATVATLRGSATDRDEVVLDARPDLGLREDPLRLESDTALREQLLDSAAARAAGELRKAAVDRRRAALLAEAAGADGEAALEARVAAAVLLMQVDRGAAESELRGLMAGE